MYHKASLVLRFTTNSLANSTACDDWLLLINYYSFRMSFLCDITFPGWQDAWKGEEEQVPCGCTVPLTLADGRHAFAPERNHGTTAVD